MAEPKSLMDLAMAFGLHAQETLDFLADEANHRKLKRYLDFQSGNIVTKSTQAEDILTTKIRIAMTGGVFLTKEEWVNGNYAMSSVIGIAVITPCVKFILGLEEWQACWSRDTDHCITGKHNEAQALQILSGYEATKQLVKAQKNEGDTAAKLCWDYRYKNYQWYLPCLLELNAVAANSEEINELLKSVGGDTLDFDATYWSSIEYSTGNSWYVSFSSWYSDGSGKPVTAVVRPVLAI